MLILGDKIMTEEANNTVYQFVCYTDGASRGNPGEAGCGVIIHDTITGKKYRYGKYLGKQTCNYAEYNALILCLEKLIELDAKSAHVIADSQLVVQQINGVFKVKNKNIIPLFNRCKTLIQKIPQFKIEHTYRSGNSEADEMANIAIDKKL